MMFTKVLCGQARRVKSFAKGVLKLLVCQECAANAFMPMVHEKNHPTTASVLITHTGRDRVGLSFKTTLQNTYIYIKKIRKDVAVFRSVAKQVYEEKKIKPESRVRSAPFPWVHFFRIR